jgi:cytochrome c
MLKPIKMVIVAGAALLMTGAIVPARASTPDQAKALAEKAAVLVASEGEKAFAIFDDPKGEFVQGDLYVVVEDHQAVVRAHINPTLVGMNMWDATDPDGVKFGQDAVKIGDATGTGWLSYKMKNPVSKKIESKKVWVHKVGDYVILCGAYVTE